MSSHDGIICCPAIKENTDKKYIVKIISVPASQAQMDALLLAGAYKDPADAVNYFREMGEGILKEAELLKTLSKLARFFVIRRLADGAHRQAPSGLGDLSGGQL